MGLLRKAKVKMKQQEDQIKDLQKKLERAGEAKAASDELEVRHPATPSAPQSSRSIQRGRPQPPHPPCLHLPPSHRVFQPTAPPRCPPPFPPTPSQGVRAELLEATTKAEAEASKAKEACAEAESLRSQLQERMTEVEELKKRAAGQEEDLQSVSARSITITFVPPNSTCAKRRTPRVACYCH